jgi:hypothetical protein
MSARDVIEALSDRPEPPAGLTRKQWYSLVRNYFDAILDLKDEARRNQTAWRNGGPRLEDVAPETRSRCWRALSAIHEAGVHSNVANRLINAVRVADNGPLVEPYDQHIRNVADDLAEYDAYLRRLPQLPSEDTPW